MGGDPLTLDISTSAVANGKIRLAHFAGKKCPPGWLQDAQGNPTTDPSVRFTDPRGTILPMGGEQGYKGFGLSVMLDILASGLSGGVCPPAGPPNKMTNNTLLVAWNPETFAGMLHFTGEADKLIRSVRESQPKPGIERVRLPGDRLSETFAERRRDGIPLDAGTCKALATLARELDVSRPQWLAGDVD
jgi:LDH2 family malate/lactate/ureidoglycolate dehydrogenase